MLFISVHAGPRHFPSLQRPVRLVDPPLLRLDSLPSRSPRQRLRRHRARFVKGKDGRSQVWPLSL